MRRSPEGEAAPAPPDTGLPDLVNRLAQELADARRSLAGAKQKLGAASRSLEGRTHELAEARAALSLLLATLDSSFEGILAIGYFGRAMHYNARFVEIWNIPPVRLEALNDAALLALQLAQVKDPQAFLALAEARHAQTDETPAQRVELTDGRWLECRVMPQLVRGKRVGTVTSYRDVTADERLQRVISALEAQCPAQLAQARTSTY